MSLSWTCCLDLCFFFFFSSRRRHTRLQGDWSSDVCSSDLERAPRKTNLPQRSAHAPLCEHFSYAIVKALRRYPLYREARPVRRGSRRHRFRRAGAGVDHRDGKHTSAGERVEGATMRAVGGVIRVGNARAVLAEERCAKIRERVDVAADAAGSFGDPFRRRPFGPGLSARSAEMFSGGYICDRQGELLGCGAVRHRRRDLVSSVDREAGNLDDVLLRIELVPGDARHHPLVHPSSVPVCSTGLSLYPSRPTQNAANSVSFVLLHLIEGSFQEPLALVKPAPVTA